MMDDYDPLQADNDYDMLRRIMYERDEADSDLPPLDREEQLAHAILKAGFHRAHNSGIPTDPALDTVCEGCE